MKLYYTPGACSLSAHIVAQEAGLPLALEKVDLISKRTQSGRDFTGVNPLGYVPVLELEDGSVMTEAAVITQYLADRKPDSGLAPPAGTPERYRLQQWLNFFASELHKLWGPFFVPTTPPERKAALKEQLAQRFAFLESKLGQQSYVLGEKFTIADAYLYAILNWSNLTEVVLPRALAEYVRRIAARTGVQAALRAEGLA